jgi:superfamily I DNA/RNA helicase
MPDRMKVVPDLLSNMNPQQREGIVSVDGAVLLLAGAGSGKTRVITHRIAYLIEERGVSPDNILAVTFTNKAAKEMGERVEKILGHSTLAQPTIATFHSFCVRVLRRDIEALRVGNVGLTRSFAIYDETDQQAVVKSALKRLGIDDKSLKPRVALGRISWAKNHMIDPQEYFLASTNPMEEKIAHIFEIYKKELAKANALDFDDLLLETVRLLKSSSEVRERYNRKYKYLLIDEYQDTNRPQYELMKLLGKHGNVCVVGDEDQSIYSWRGADIKNILEFEKDFPEAKTIRLEQNYRSTQVILEGASAVVAQNVQRKGKNLWTSREGGSLIGYYEAPDGENEALFIADRIAQYIREAAAGTDNPAETPRCAVLYRTNSQSRLVEEALRRYQIQYHMVGGFSFYDRAEVKDMLSYLKLVQNPHDSVALGRVVNSPPRGIGKTTMETLERIALTTGMSSWDAIERVGEEKLLPARALTALANFRKLIEDARAMLGAEFVAKLEADAGSREQGVGSSEDDYLESLAASADDEATNFDFGFATEEEPAPATTNDANSSFDTSFNFGFDFGPSEEISTIAPENVGANYELPPPVSYVPTYEVISSDDADDWYVKDDGIARLNKILARLVKEAEKIGTSAPRADFSEVTDGWYRARIHFDPQRVGDWRVIAVAEKAHGSWSVLPMSEETIPAGIVLDDGACDHCHLKRHRETVFLLRKEDRFERVGSTCVEQFTGVTPRAVHFSVEAKRELRSYIAEIGIKAIPLYDAQLGSPSETPLFANVGAVSPGVLPYSQKLKAEDNPFAPVALKRSASDEIRDRLKRIAAEEARGEVEKREERPAFRKLGDPATLPELIKFLNDRSGYIRSLEEENTPESQSRIENLKELANAAQDATSRGETLAEFLDHAALVSDADSYSAEARVTLMTLHAAKGLEFPLVFLAGMEEGLFPHSRTLQDPEQMEEERRLCYVGMTRAMDTLMMTRARYRRRYGSDMPESSIASRFLEEVPSRLVEDLSPKSYGSAYATPYPRRGGGDDYGVERHYSYEDESQEPGGGGRSGAKSYAAERYGSTKPRSGSGPLDNTAAFFGKGGSGGGLSFKGRPRMEIGSPTGKTGMGKGIRVRHPKYGEGVIFAREGEGEDAKITVQFSGHGMKKLVEKFAQLERL